MAKTLNARDITWLAFNHRVMQEAMDKSVPLDFRIRFLGIFSNNLDEFFRVRVPSLKRALAVKEQFKNDTFFFSPEKILEKINQIVISHQETFVSVWEGILQEMTTQGIFIKTPKDLSPEQKNFVKNYFYNEVEDHIVPILLHENKEMPYLRDKSLYLGISMKKSKAKFHQNLNFAVIEVPTQFTSRFITLPSEENQTHMILLEDIIYFMLPNIFGFFGYDEFQAHAFKVTKDAEFDLDNDIETDLSEKIEKALKNRRKGKPTRFVFDKNMNPNLLDFLIRKLNLSKKDSIIPGGKIHNFKDFMAFPSVFKNKEERQKITPFLHSEFQNKNRITDVILKKNVMLTLPYHEYRPVIDLLRESAIDPEVRSIQITAYRLAENSKIANALINAARNGKSVVVMLELQARFDEEANLKWKKRFEQEGIKVLTGISGKKIHAKLCIIKKRTANKTLQYGFISTGNFNEKTAKIYGDFLLFTSDRMIMADINRIFKILNSPPKNGDLTELSACKKLWVSPITMREKINQHIQKEIDEAQNDKPAKIILKLNSLSDKQLIEKLYQAAKAGVEIKIIVRGIYCALNHKNFKKKIEAISIVDEFLEHARVMYFYHKGEEKMYISSADWMTRNIDYRIETAVPITNPEIKNEILDILNLQLKDNVKARILDSKLKNKYVKSIEGQKEIRSQVEIYHYLLNKK